MNSDACFSSSLLTSQSSSMGSSFFLGSRVLFEAPSSPCLDALFLLDSRRYMLPLSPWSTSVLMERVRERRSRGGGFSGTLCALRRSIVKMFCGTTKNGLREECRGDRNGYRRSIITAFILVGGRWLAVLNRYTEYQTAQPGEEVIRKQAV